jgi:DNA-directed RNA polymerase specialized sigma24 family protein
MLVTRKAEKREPFRYAMPADFCRIFEEDMNRLYRLSLLLTGDHSLAEKCFVRGLADAKSSNPVFAERAQSWAVRKIVQSAIEMIHPRSTANLSSSSISQHYTEHAKTEPEEIARILALPAFDRFAFVLSVLERYPDKECALLLDCTVSDLAAARIRAMQQIGKSAERHFSAINIVADGRGLRCGT